MAKAKTTPATKAPKAPKAKVAKPTLELVVLEGNDPIHAAIVTARQVAVEQNDMAAVAGLTRVANARAKIAGRAGEKAEKAKASLAKKLESLNAAAVAAGVSLAELLGVTKPAAE